MSLDQAWVWLARIRRAQGRKGEVLAEILTDFPEKFSERKRVWLLHSAGLGAAGLDAARLGAAARPAPAIPPPREAVLRSHWLNKSQAGGIVLHFDGVDSISQAEALRGMVVAIPRSGRAALGEDEFYAGDLIGCLLVDVASTPERAVGVIEDVDREAGPVALLVVAGAPAGEEVLVPFAKAYLRRIDLEAQRVEMALPEGLVEVQLPDSLTGQGGSGQDDAV